MGGNDVYEMFRRFEDVVEAYGPFQGLHVAFEASERNPETIWSFRKPLGHDYSQD